MSSLRYANLKGGGRTKKSPKPKNECTDQIQMECHRIPSCRYVVQKESSNRKNYCRRTTRRNCRGKKKRDCTSDGCSWSAKGKRKFCRTARNSPK